MNIFFLDWDPVKAAQSLCDKHVVSQAKETAQIISTVSWRYGVEAPCKETHKNHPVVRWAGETYANWLWTVDHGAAICREYTRRYHKIHKLAFVSDWAKESAGRPTLQVLTNPALAMPEEYKQDDPIEAYRAYYRGDKIRFAKWKPPSLPPTWWPV